MERAAGGERRSHSAGASPSSTFPPGNSQRYSPQLPFCRWQIRMRPPRVMIPAVTTIGIRILREQRAGGHYQITSGPSRRAPDGPVSHSMIVEGGDETGGWLEEPDLLHQPRGEGTRMGVSEAGVP